MRSLALLILLAGPASAEDGVQLRAIASGQVTLTGETDPAVTPAADLEVDGPLAFGSSAPLRISARLRILGLPGETVDLASVETFRAAELSLGAYKRIGQLQVGGQEVWTSVEARWSFSSRMPHEPAALDRYARAYGLGLRVEERRSGARLSLLYGRHEAAGPRGLGQILVSGVVPLAFAKGTFVLGGDAILSAGPPRYGAHRDVFQLHVGTDLSKLYRLLSGS